MPIWSLHVVLLIVAILSFECKKEKEPFQTAGFDAGSPDGGGVADAGVRDDGGTSADAGTSADGGAVADAGALGHCAPKADLTFPDAGAPPTSIIRVGTPRT